MQACGLNDVGLTALNKMGESMSARKVRNIKTSLAIIDEQNVKKMAKHQYISIVIDNLDKSVKKVVQHKTLPILLCRSIPDIVHNLDTKRKGLEDVILNYSVPFFLLDSPRHSEEKEAFLKVTKQ